MNKIMQAGVLPKSIVLNSLDEYLVMDEVFWEEAVICLNIPCAEELEDKSKRMLYLEVNCLYNAGRGYVLQMLVLKHLFRLLKESCFYCIDEFSVDLMKKGGLI